MAKLQNYNGRYCEWEFEYAFLDYLEKEGWQYLSGNSIVRASKRDVLYVDDLEQFLSKSNPDLTVDEIRQIMDTVRLVGAESDFAVLHKVYNWMVNGIQFVPQTGLARMVALIDFDEPKNNIFRAVNQFTVEYTNNGQTVNRRPDILLFVNGLPLCVMELKNPADKNATIDVHLRVGGVLIVARGLDAQVDVLVVRRDVALDLIACFADVLVEVLHSHHDVVHGLQPLGCVLHGVFLLSIPERAKCIDGVLCLLEGGQLVPAAVEGGDGSVAVLPAQPQLADAAFVDSKDTGLVEVLDFEPERADVPGRPVPAVHGDDGFHAVPPRLER